MATVETLLWYDQQQQFFISPLIADAALQAVLDAVPAAELRAAPLVLQHFKQQDLSEKRFAIVKDPLQIHPLWLHKDERLVSLVLIIMLALLVYCLLEHLVRQAQRYLTGRALLELFGSYRSSENEMDKVKQPK